MGIPVATLPGAGRIGSALVRFATSISMWLHVQLSGQIGP